MFSLSSDEVLSFFFCSSFVLFLCCLLGRLPGRLHDLLEGEGLAQVAAHLDLAGHERGSGGKFTYQDRIDSYHVISIETTVLNRIQLEATNVLTTVLHNYHKKLSPEIIDPTVSLISVIT